MVGLVGSGMLTGKFKCHISMGKVKLPYGFPYFLTRALKIDPRKYPRSVLSACRGMKKS